MNTKQAAKILEDFNRWRRGDDPIPLTMLNTSPKDIGLAIDVAVKALKKK